MTISEAPPVAPAPAEPAPSSFGRIFGVLFSPDATMASIARRPTWVAPLLVLIVLSFVSGFIMSSRIDWSAPAREAMEGRKDVSAEQSERAVRMAGAMGKVIAYAGPVFLMIILAIVAGILLLAFRIMGGEGNFGQAWAVTLYAYMPSVIKSIAFLIILVAKNQTGISPVAMATLVRSNPAFLFDPKTNPMAFALATNFDIFSLWVMILLIIGFAHLAKVSKAKSAAIVVSLYIVKCLLGLIGPAMQSLRK